MVDASARTRAATWTIRIGLAAGSVFWLVGLTGCQAFIDLQETQCREDRECVALLGRDWTCSDNGVCLSPEMKEPEGLPDRWRCLEQDPKSVPHVMSEKVEVSFVSVDYESLLVPEGLEARACNLTDPDCDSPLFEHAKPDDEGFVTLEVTKGFSGFFELTAPSVLPTLFYSNKGYEADARFAGPVLVNADTVVKLSARGDIAADLSKGLAIFMFWDCDGDAAPGVSLSRRNGAPGEVFYFDGALPDRDLTSSRATDALSMNGGRIAAAGITNIEPGFENFDVVHEASGMPIGSYTAEIRAGQMTTVYMYAGY